MRLIAYAALATLSSCSFEAESTRREASAYALCDARISGNLVAPSSYKVVWRHYNDRSPITFAERQKNINAIIDEMESRKSSLTIPQEFELQFYKEDRANGKRDKPIYEASKAATEPTGFAIIEYDATNRFGVPLRAFAYCHVSEMKDDQSFSRVFSYGDIGRAEGERQKTAFDVKTQAEVLNSQ